MQKNIKLSLLSFVTIAAIAGIFLLSGEDNARAQSEIATSQIDPSISLSAQIFDGLTMEQALSSRSIGSDDAPVILHEYSSLSCGHCAKFHGEVLPKLKEEFVDTGKVKIIFHDFPLNRPAFIGSLAARCLPDANHYSFLQLLFETQAQWAFTSDFQEKLSQSARLAGLSQENFDLCVNNKALQEGLIEHVQAAQNKYQIRSTPSFVFDGDNAKIEGAADFQVFADAINKRLKK